MAINQISISKIFSLATEPSNAVVDRFWFDTTNNELKRYDGTNWVPIKVNADDIKAVYPDNTTTTLSDYLSTLTSAVGDLNTNKQDKLLYYSEISGDTPSTTISVANIKLEGNVVEGYGAIASGDYSHAEGYGAIASGDYSHAEGGETNASGSYSHAEGFGTTASGSYSHAEGFGTTASGDYSHTQGQYTTASGSYSHAEGQYTTASGSYSHTQGKYSIEDANNKYADIIGNGSSINARSNAATMSWDGISWSQTDVRAGGTDQDAATHSLAAKQNITDDTLTTSNKTIVGAINEVKGVNDSQATSISSLNDKTSNLITINQDGGLISSHIEGDLYVSANSSSSGGKIYISSLEVNKVVTTADNGRLKSSEVTTTELEYLTGTTSNIQTQINSLQSQLNLDHPTNTVSAFIITPSSNTAGVSITDGSGSVAAGKGGKIIVSPTGTNIGAVYVTTELTKPTALPIYPNTIVEFGPYADLSDVLIYVDSLGDSVSVQLSHV